MVKDDVMLDLARHTAADTTDCIYTQSHMQRCLTVALGEIDRVQAELNKLKELLK